MSKLFLLVRIGPELVDVESPVLLQKVVLEKLGDFESNLVGFGERCFSDQLHDFRKILFLLKDLLDLGTKRDEFLEILVVKIVESAKIFTVRYEPIDGWKVFALSEFLVETPEYLYDTEGGTRHGIGKVTTGRRNSTDYTDGTFAIWITEALDATGALVETGEPGTEIRGITRIGGHLGKSTGNFAKCLGPTRSRIGHHGNIVTHVSEVLG